MAVLKRKEDSLIEVGKGSYQCSGISRSGVE
jgi:hypothetical protein